MKITICDNYGVLTYAIKTVVVVKCNKLVAHKREGAKSLTCQLCARSFEVCLRYLSLLESVLNPDCKSKFEPTCLDMSMQGDLTKLKLNLAKANINERNECRWRIIDANIELKRDKSGSQMLKPNSREQNLFLTKSGYCYCKTILVFCIFGLHTEPSCHFIWKGDTFSEWILKEKPNSTWGMTHNVCRGNQAGSAYHIFRDFLRWIILLFTEWSTSTCAKNEINPIMFVWYEAKTHIATHCTAVFKSRKTPVNKTGLKCSCTEVASVCIY